MQNVAMLFPVFAGLAFDNLEITAGRQSACLLILLRIIRSALITGVRVRNRIIAYTIGSEDKASFGSPHFRSQYLTGLTALAKGFNHEASMFIEGKIGAYFGQRPRVEEGALRNTTRRFGFSRRDKSCQNKQYRRNYWGFHDLIIPNQNNFDNRTLYLGRPGQFVNA